MYTARSAVNDLNVIDDYGMMIGDGWYLSHVAVQRTALFLIKVNDNREHVDKKQKNEMTEMEESYWLKK